MVGEFIPLHRQLVHTLSQFEVFQVDNGEEGKPLFKMRKHLVTAINPNDYTATQLEGAANLVAVLFNLYGPKLGWDFDLPKLLQAYFLDEGKRKEINKLLQG